MRPWPSIDCHSNQNQRQRNGRHHLLNQYRQHSHSGTHRSEKSSHRLFAMVTIVAIVAHHHRAKSATSNGDRGEKICTETVPMPSYRAEADHSKRGRKAAKTTKKPKKVKNNQTKTPARKIVEKKTVEPKPEPKPEHRSRKPQEPINTEVPKAPPEVVTKETSRACQNRDPDLEPLHKPRQRKPSLLSSFHQSRHQSPSDQHPKYPLLEIGSWSPISSTMMGNTRCQSQSHQLIW